jgi:putative salt-induced outer membrane protein YdiY
MLWMVLGALIANPALAEDPEFAGTDDPNQKFDKPEGALSAEFGGAYASGNVEYLTINGLINGSYRWDRNKLTGTGAANIGRTRLDADESGTLSTSERAAPLVKTSQRFDSELRYDRYLGDNGSLYALAGAFIDPFAGYDLRSHEQLGYSRMLVDNDSTDLVAELGADYAQEFYTDQVLADNPDLPDLGHVVAARLLIGVQHKFNEQVSFSEVVEIYENVLNPADLRVLNEAAFTSKLSDKFSLKLSNQLIFDNVPPGSEYAKYDQVTLVTLVASIL